MAPTARGQATRCESVQQGTSFPVGGWHPSLDYSGDFLTFIGFSDLLSPGRPTCRTNRFDVFTRSITLGLNGWLVTGSPSGLAVYTSYESLPLYLDSRHTAVSGLTHAVSGVGGVTTIDPPGDPNCAVHSAQVYPDIILYLQAPVLVTGFRNYCDPPPNPVYPSKSSSSPSWSAMGDRLAFTSGIYGLMPPPDPLACPPAGASWYQVYVDDLLLPRVRASTSNLGNVGNGHSYRPALSGNGRYVAFTSEATNLLEPELDLNGEADIFVHDLVTGTTRRVSVSTEGTEASGGPSDNCSISYTGRFVAFASAARNLAYPSTLTQADLIHVYIHDRDVSGNAVFDEPGDIRTVLVDVTPSNVEAGTTSPIAVWSYPAISSDPDPSRDGRYIAWDSTYRDIVPLTTLDVRQIYVREFVEGAFDSHRITIASVSNGGQEGDDDSRLPCISSNGRHVVFESKATNLDPSGDTNHVPDIYRNDNPVRSCYANCDGSTTPPILNVGDYICFICFLNKLNAGDPYANCDGSTAPPILNTSDFICFLNAYAAGC